MKNKQSSYAHTGLIIGILVGAIAALGALTLIKESQRGQMVWFAIGISCLVFGIMGFSKGSSLGREMDIENELGISDAQDEILNNGKSRVWYAVTTWNNKNTNLKSTLHTIQNEKKELVSLLNNEIIYYHNVKSGSKVNVSKFHKEARNLLFKKLKDSNWRNSSKG